MRTISMVVTMLLEQSTPPPYGRLGLGKILKFLGKDVQSGTATRPPEGDRAAVPPCTSTACNNNNNNSNSILFIKDLLRKKIVQ